MKKTKLNNMEIYDVVEEPVVQDVKAVAEEPNEDLKEEGFLTKIWNKTIFPDMIRAKREERALKRQVEHEARLEALKDMKGELKQVYVQKQKDKLTGKKKKDFLEKLAKGFENDGGIGSTNKINQMLGKDTPNNKEVDVLAMMGTGQNDKGMFDIGKALGTDKKKKK